MDDLYEIIKSFESENLKIEKTDCGHIYLYIRGSYTEEFMNVLKEYGKTHHLRMRRMYPMPPDDFSMDVLFTAGFLSKKERPCQFILFG